MKTPSVHKLLQTHKKKSQALKSNKHLTLLLSRLLGTQACARALFAPITTYEKCAKYINETVSLSVKILPTLAGCLEENHKLEKTSTYLQNSSSKRQTPPRII